MTQMKKHQGRQVKKQKSKQQNWQVAKPEEAGSDTAEN